MRIGIFTSSRAISLRKVAQDISKVFYRQGIEAEIFPTSAPLDEEVLSLDGAIIVMPVDLTFHVDLRINTTGLKLWASLCLLRNY